MAGIVRNKLVRAGDWRTLESAWNAAFTCLFQAPAGAQVKVRYGDGWPFGRDGQRQTLDGTHNKAVSVGRASLVYARVQIKVKHDTEVSYTYIPTGP